MNSKFPTRGIVVSTTYDSRRRQTNHYGSTGASKHRARRQTKTDDPVATLAAPQGSGLRHACPYSSTGGIHRTADEDTRTPIATHAVPIRRRTETDEPHSSTSGAHGAADGDRQAPTVAQAVPTGRRTETARAKGSNGASSADIARIVPIPHLVQMRR